MTNEPLNKAEYELLAKLLRMASDEFENHGSNDFELENTQPNRFLMQEFEKDNCPETPYDLMISPDGKEIYANDSALMSYMSDRCKTLAEHA